ncbi:Flp family type IVb pilin [Pseudomonas sp. p1(2021b)]|uniref:Flp family type IVb pilin n=1 Tax=Pseudomonas sp. p1(2021b) TaxID=2874628 RepID=UPI001CD03A5C|nr:Flp family type IVb pilin [Pseudomonas sp. p1(2021b)]UBM24773.1 Flp family type IVb pilin [Pseudomonas sp. p1(2021b)]
MLLKLFVHCKVFLQRKDGASGIEYALIAAMVAVVLASFTTEISTQVDNIMNAIKEGITTTSPTDG